MKEVELLVDDHHGVYVPMVFAQVYNSPENFKNYDEISKDLEFLANEVNNPNEIENYWYAWEDVERTAILVFSDGSLGYLYQDGDLWAIPNDLTDEQYLEFFGESRD